MALLRGRKLLALNFTHAAAQTRLQILQQDPPLRVIRAFQNETSEAVVHLHNVSGGVLGGDSLGLRVTVEPGAQAQITSTSATRVYKRRAGQPSAMQCSVFQIGEESLLEYLPDPVILFGESAFSQTTHFHLAKGAGLIWWEILSVGRIASGETAAFENYSVDTAIYGGGKALALERYVLKPQTHNLSSPARLGGFSYSASLYICRVDDNQSQWARLESDLSVIAEELSSPEVRWGVSTLILNGIIVRGLARQAHQVTNGLHRFWAKAKADIWGRPATLPRKVH